MHTLKVSNPTLNLWRKRYLECGVAELVKGKTRAPGTPRLAQEKVQEILTLTMIGCRALELSHDGRASRSLKDAGQSDLARAQTQTAPG